jgi:hypothetical protein
VNKIELPKPTPERAAELFPESPQMQAAWLRAQHYLEQHGIEPRPWWGNAPKQEAA